MIKLGWYDNDKKILIADFSGNWTWKEFKESHLEERELCKDFDHKIYLIANNVGVHIPRGSFLTIVNDSINSVRDTRECVYVIVQNRYLESMLKILLSMFGDNDLKIVKSFSEAIDAINKSLEGERD